MPKILLLLGCLLKKNFSRQYKKLKEVQNALSDASEESEKAKRLVKLTEGLATHEDIDILFMDVMKNSCELLGCDRSTLWIKSSTTDELYSKVALGTDSIRIHTSKGLVGHSYRNCVTVNIKDAYNDARKHILSSKVEKHLKKIQNG